MRNAIRVVLTRISEQFPDDHATLCRIVLAIEPLADEDAAKGIRGKWQGQEERSDDPMTWSWGFSKPAPGTLYLIDRREKHAVALVAHELGHAITTFFDLQMRGDAEDEWASELTADWYAYRWGFCAEIEAHRPTRDWRHHGVPPGGAYEVHLQEGKVACYEVGSDFTVRCVSRQRSPSGKRGKTALSPDQRAADKPTRRGRGSKGSN